MKKWLCWEETSSGGYLSFAHRGTLAGVRAGLGSASTALAISVLDRTTAARDSRFPSSINLRNVRLPASAPERDVNAKSVKLFDFKSKYVNVLDVCKTNTQYNKHRSQGESDTGTPSRHHINQSINQSHGMSGAIIITRRPWQMVEEVASSPIALPIRFSRMSWQARDRRSLPTTFRSGGRKI
jgi:hypothetical protein